ncbi:pyruvate decarboxylase PdcB [Mucor mucedo]|uniref:pyruvate decarboxylase PdcB n=1 Tax=Mucor mucedo TaxID=29922 RepID=UPI00221F79AE|nr:pyruvate decarboxylase PdcB [Mucor mucedo]KAI7889493.1 pyruvate decarboxylase PdcB [Mucor mucedo]
MTTTISIGNYLLRRLKEINIETIFGVPGDYNMPFLDLIEDDNDLTWGNNANELNASYAADGYARVRGAGAVVTTFGVGELSAVNGIAGSYSEMLPVIHIVGTPVTSSQNSHALLHHSLGNGDFQVFTKMSSLITVAAAHLSPERALEEIDHVIKTAYLRKRPGYIGFPLDLMLKKVSVTEHQLKPLDLANPPNPKEVQEIALQKILEHIAAAKNPAIIVDGCVLRQHLEKEANAFVVRSGFPTFSAPMGKGAIDERLPNFRGCYSGNVTLEGITKEVEEADLLIELGSIKSDFNTGNFSYGLEKKKTISLHSFGTTIYHADYNGVCMSELLPLLTASLPENPKELEFGARVRPDPIDESTQEITHNYLWNKVPDFIEPNSIIVAETGTAEFGVFNMNSPKGTSFISQILWGSIGYSVGAALGAAMADRSRRVYLFVGDGSFQLTVQEVSVYIRHGITPVILLLNNDGYLIEKLIHGPHRSYNNYQMWKYSQTLDFFGGHLEHNRTGQGKNPSAVGVEEKVTTRTEFEAAMEKAHTQPDKIHFLEVIMPRFDAPRELKLLVASSENR